MLQARDLKTSLSDFSLTKDYAFELLVTTGLRAGTYTAPTY
jgi:hypothetical protein